MILSTLVFLKDLCLEGSLTIKESFEYYGMLYNVHKKDIAKRIKQLSEFLELPSLDSYIKFLR